VGICLKRRRQSEGNSTPLLIKNQGNPFHKIFIWGRPDNKFQLSILNCKNPERCLQFFMQSAQASFCGVGEASGHGSLRLGEARASKPRSEVARRATERKQKFACADCKQRYEILHSIIL
jgi:hypothetical protein